MRTIIGFLEFSHFILHLCVLSGYLKLTTNLKYKKIYFTIDLISVIIAYLFLKTPLLLVLIHFIIHFQALLHLFEFKSDFFAFVFDTAHQNLVVKSRIMQTLYILGTLEDIFLHAIGFYLALT